MNLSIGIHLESVYTEKAIIRTKKFPEFSVLKLDKGCQDVSIFIESHETVNALMNALSEIREHINARENEQEIESNTVML